MPKWLKVWLISLLAGHAALTVVDGRRCSLREGSCAAARGSCGSCESSEPACSQVSEPAGVRCAVADRVCDALCGEGARCSEWLCLLCRCDDQAPSVRQRVPEPPKLPAPAKPALVGQSEWGTALAALVPVVVPCVALSPPARLAVLCIWRL